MKTKYTNNLITGLYLLLGVFLLNLSISTVSAKGIFKCVKPNGEVEYTQTASKDCNAQPIKKHGGNADQKAIDKLHEDGKRNKIAQDEQQDEQLKKQDEARAKKEQEKYCTELRENLEQITIAHRVFETNDKGERIRLDEEQRQQRILENQKSLGTHCS